MSVNTYAASDKYGDAEHFNRQNHLLLAVTATPLETLPNHREGLPTDAHIQQLITKANTYTLNPNGLHRITDH